MDRISQLENENRWLKEEIVKLRSKLSMVKPDEWAHPQSCVNNCDPWKTWTSQNFSS